MSQTYAWADHRIFETEGVPGGRPLLYGADHASLFALDPSARDVLARWGSQDTIVLRDVPAGDREALDALRDARVLVPTQLRQRTPLPAIDPAAIPLGTLGCELEIGGRRFVFLVKAREGYSNLMEIFNRREVRGASGLVVIYVPEGGARRDEEDTKDKKGDTSKDMSPSCWPDEAAMIAGLRKKAAPGDLYIGADFANFNRVRESGGHVPISAKSLHVPDPLAESDLLRQLHHPGAIPPG